jgi:peroxiredoxin
VDAARDALAAAGCSVLVVCQARPEVLSLYLARHPWRVPVVSDPDRAAYRAFELKRTGWLTFFRPKVLAGYLKKIFRGHRVRRPYAGEDVLQLGGDFVLDRRREVVAAFAASDPTARPSVADILRSLPPGSDAATGS